jgi:carbohydrate-selective porin OprB
VALLELCQLSDEDIRNCTLGCTKYENAKTGVVVGQQQCIAGTERRQCHQQGAYNVEVQCVQRTVSRAARAVVFLDATSLGRRRHRILEQ